MYTFEKKLQMVSDAKNSKPIRFLSREHNLYENLDMI